MTDKPTRLIIDYDNSEVTVYSNDPNIQIVTVDHDFESSYKPKILPFSHFQRERGYNYKGDDAAFLDWRGLV